jgi:hypothetical protein
LGTRGGDKPPENGTRMTTAIVVSRCPVCRGRLYDAQLYPELVVCGTCGREFSRSQIAAVRADDDVPTSEQLAEAGICEEHRSPFCEHAFPSTPEPAPEPAAERKPRTYKPKVCSCGETFTPTGPRDIRCTPCKARF